MLWRRTTETPWRRSTQTSLDVSFETYLRRHWNVQREVASTSLRRLVAGWVMVEKDIRGGVCHSIFQYAKTNKRHMKIYDKNNLLIFSIGMLIIYMVGQCHENFH